jgi:site-specific DNA-methyltransferase (adenine-specific)
MRGDRTGSTSAKYLRSDSRQADYLPQFAGDNKDMRGYLMWSALWMGAALDLANPGCVLSCFTDWRQWTPTTDAMQAGGWIWRGALPWVKPAPRPSQGRFAQGAEFIVWGSAGPMADEGPCHPGDYRGPAPHDREHITQKPLELLRMLVAITPPGGLVLDPFNGSGTTGVAALLGGYRYIGIERTEDYCAISARRLAEAEGQMGEGRHGQMGLLT